MSEAKLLFARDDQSVGLSIKTIAKTILPITDQGQSYQSNKISGKGEKPEPPL